MSLDDLPLEAAEHIAGHLVDEGDLVSLQESCRFWAGVYESPTLWAGLVKARFGQEHVPKDAREAHAVFKRLARLQAAVKDGNVVWLNDPHRYLEVVSAANSISAQVVRLNHVCWLDLSVRVPGVLPGRYQAQCRLLLLPGFFVDELQITATPLGEDGGGAGAGQPVGRVYSWDQLRALERDAGHTWVELSSGASLEVSRLCQVELKVHSHTGSWKRNVLFDQLRLVRLGGAGEDGGGGGGDGGGSGAQGSGWGDCVVQ